MIREVAGAITIVKKTHCLHNEIVNFGKERSNNHHISIFLCFYTLCAKSRFINHCYILQSGPLLQFPPVLVCSCGSHCSGLVLTLLIPAFSTSLIKSPRTGFMLNCTLASYTVQKFNYGLFSEVRVSGPQHTFSVLVCFSEQAQWVH